jgi:hypothetical protein
MTEQEQAQFRECHRTVVQQVRSQQAAQRQLPNQNQVENESFDGFKTTVGSLLDFLKNSDDPGLEEGTRPAKASLWACFAVKQSAHRVRKMSLRDGICLSSHPERNC